MRLILLEHFALDARHALRSLRLRPLFTLTAVVTVALGAAANIAIFQLIDAVRLRTLPVAAPGELVELRPDDMTHARGAWLREGGLTTPLWERIRSEADLFDGAFAWGDETLDLTGSGESRKIAALWVSGEFFPVLRLRSTAGRLFARPDDRRGCGAGPGVVLSHAFWRQAFGGDRSIVGRPISIGRRATTVLGVAPEGFSGLEVGRRFDVALLLCAEPVWHGAAARADSGTVWWLSVMARRRPSVSLAGLDAAMRARSAAIFQATLPAGYPPASVAPYLAMTLTAVDASRGVSRLRGIYGAPLAWLLGVSGLVLLIACLNLAHLMMARATSRAGEWSMRAALGATRGRLIQQVGAEGFVLTAAATGLGLLAGTAIARMVVTTVASSVANGFLDVSVDGRTLTFAAILAAAACVVFSTLPVWPAAVAAGQNLGRPPSRDTRREVAGALLAASQLGLSLALVGGALLMTRSLDNLKRIDPGFAADRLVIADVAFSNIDAADPARALRNDLVARLRSTPHVVGAAEVLTAPLTGAPWNNRMWLDGGDPGRARVVMRGMIGEGYFTALGTPLVAGRDFGDADMQPTSPKVAIVNRRFAQEFGLSSAVGQRFWIERTPLEPSAAYEIVGLAGDTAYHDIREPSQSIVYVPLWQSALRRPAGQFVIRGGSGDAVAGDVRAALESFGRTRYSIRTYRAILDELLLPERLMAALAAPFGVLAVVLTAVGLYGVFAYRTAQRTREIGIRIALGATGRQILASIARDLLAVLVVGLAGGAALAIAVGRSARALLFGVRPDDPVSLALAAAILVSVAAAATYFPARRAARVDPALTLRHD